MKKVLVSLLTKDCVKDDFRKYIKSQSFGFWGTHRVDAMKKDAVKKEGSTKGAKNKTQSYFLIKPNQPYSPSGS